MFDNKVKDNRFLELLPTLPEKFPQELLFRVAENNGSNRRRTAENLHKAKKSGLLKALGENWFANPQGTGKTVMLRHKQTGSRNQLTTHGDLLRMIYPTTTKNRHTFVFDNGPAAFTPKEANILTEYCSSNVEVVESEENEETFKEAITDIFTTMLTLAPENVSLYILENLARIVGLPPKTLRHKLKESTAVKTLENARYLNHKSEAPAAYVVSDDHITAELKQREVIQEYPEAQLYGELRYLFSPGQPVELSTIEANALIAEYQALAIYKQQTQE